VLRRRSIAIAVAATQGLAPGLAQTTTDAPEPATTQTQTQQVTITATRTERPVDDVPATVTVIPAEAIEQSGARDIKDLLRNEIDVTVRAAPTRFSAAGSATGRAGNEGINIRGLEGNQVLIVADGIRVPNSFSFGAFSTGRGDFLAIDTAQAVEILRGPASTQYGSDGLAGVLSLRTLEPADLLAAGQPAGGFTRLGYASLDHSWHTGLGAAFRSGPWEGLVAVSDRRGHETGNRGDIDANDSTRTAPNPLDYSTPSVLAKMRWSPSAAHSLGIAVEAQRRNQNTEVMSARTPPPFPPGFEATATLDLDTRDRADRSRVSIDHRYADPDGGWLNKAQTQLYFQRADVRQFAAEDRNTAADRIRDNHYTQNVSGISTQLESNFGGGADSAVSHRLSYGLDASRTEIAGTRSGSDPPPGEAFPTKPFPDTRYTLAGAFVQDEIEAGAFSLIPGLRWDHYKLSPSSEGYVGGEVVTLSDQAATPRLGLIWRLNPAFAPYAQWAKGFRAPTPDQVNNGFTNLASGYISIGNANLAPERAESVELGLRGKAGPLRWSASGFDNRYRDFISQQVVGGSGIPGDPLVFQFINLDSVRIRGIELRGQWTIAERWTLNAGSALTRGHTRSPSGETTPLDTIEPARTVLGLRYDAGALAFDATLLHAQAKGAGRINPVPTIAGPAAAFASPAYTVLDIGARWKPLPRLTLIANLNNVFDNKYWRWSDVRGIAADSAVKDAYTAPGRNLSVSARYDF
jgi:hemoglobin/transferrin/lactoferrin receptor protein